MAFIRVNQRSQGWPYLPATYAKEITSAKSNSDCWIRKQTLFLLASLPRLTSSITGRKRPCKQDITQQESHHMERSTPLWWSSSIKRMNKEIKRVNRMKKKVYIHFLNVFIPIGWILSLFVSRHIFPKYIKWFNGITTNKSCNFFQIFWWSPSVLSPEPARGIIGLGESEDTSW